MNRKRVLCVFCFLLVVTVMGIVMNPVSAPSDLTLASARAPAISAGSAMLIDASDGTVLYEYNADKKMSPASTTKIMTAMVTLDICRELGVGLDSEILVPKEAEGVEGSSLYLKKGERVCLEELLYGLMLQSGNDAAAALAAALGGNTENFLERMNRKSEELGCESTHFANPHGLYDETHYTTARELAVIAREAMKDEDFRRIAAAQKWSSDDEGEDSRNFVNKNKTVFQYKGGDGIKIGYTKASGRTLVASATRGDISLIAVVLNDSDWFADAYALMDFGFETLGEPEGSEENKS